MKPAEIRFSLQRPLQHRDPDMAPTITAAMTNSQEPHTLTHKLRKPLVEKLRRERINSSIEQIKSLLQQNEKQRRLLNHVNKMQCSSDKNLSEADFSLLSSTVQTIITKEKSPVNSAPWRPW
ncbi:Transcription factor HES-5 [Dissostichus eleginoides]|uniref:Transcription factor HES-5 n=1 Tax=Dissostichus eleginoides TaxID=100907 RepID=A0AAD9FGR9_DISEL|nr:Transcription factor HES-5 [Dissostichus eleginoides]